MIIKAAIFQILFLFSPLYSVFAICPLTVSNLPGNIVLIESNYSKFKIEQDWIKQLYPSPMQENPWIFSSTASGIGHLRGIFVNDDYSEETFSEFYVVRKGAQYYWYLVIKERLGWVVAGSAKGEFTCNYIKDPDQIIDNLSETFKTTLANSKILKINPPSQLYSRLGLD